MHQNAKQEICAWCTCMHCAHVKSINVVEFCICHWSTLFDGLIERDGSRHTRPFTLSCIKGRTHHNGRRMDLQPFSTGVREPLPSRVKLNVNFMKGNMHMNQRRYVTLVAAEHLMVRWTAKSFFARQHAHTH